MGRVRNSVLCAVLPCVAGLAGHANAQLVAGPDIVYSNLTGITTYGPVSGKYAYSYSSDTCNIGNQNVEWNFSGTNGAPGFAMNLYRISDGRLQQVGLSFIKHACCAAAGSGCVSMGGGGVSCNGTGGNQLGSGCKDVYGAGYNAGQGGLGARSNINAWSGAFQPRNTGSGDAIFKRLQVNQTDMNTTVNFPNARYFGEGVYVSTREGQWTANNNRNNNASYRPVTNTGNGATLTPTGPFSQGIPAIQAWRDHGLGLNVPDTSVVVGNVDFAGEGRFWFASKPINNGDGTWRYEYAVFNLSSDASGGSFEVPVSAGVTVTNMGFSAPFYHSGEVFNNNAWTTTRTTDSVRFATDQTFAQNANANALRWGTMYNFWFTANSAPTNAMATLGAFKTSASATFSVQSPTQVNVCDGLDFNHDSQTPDTADVDDFLSVFMGGPCSTGNCGDIDFNNDTFYPDTLDIDSFLSVMSGGPCI